MGATGIGIAEGERRFFHWGKRRGDKGLSEVIDGDGEDIIVVSDGGYGIYRDALPLAIHSFHGEWNRCSACPEQGCMPHSNHGMCSLRVPGDIMCLDVASPSRVDERTIIEELDTLWQNATKLDVIAG